MPRTSKRERTRRSWWISCSDPLIAVFIGGKFYLPRSRYWIFNYSPRSRSFSNYAIIERRYQFDEILNFPWEKSMCDCAKKFFSSFNKVFTWEWKNSRCNFCSLLRGKIHKSLGEIITKCYACPLDGSFVVRNFSVACLPLSGDISLSVFSMNNKWVGNGPEWDGFIV